MRWSNGGLSKSSEGTAAGTAALLIVVLTFAVLLVSGAAPEKRLSVYSSVANYSLPMVQRQGHEYVGLLELLDPLGRVSAKSEPIRWRLHYNNILGDFVVGRS